MTIILYLAQSVKVKYISDWLTIYSAQSLITLHWYAVYLQ